MTSFLEEAAEEAKRVDLLGSTKPVSSGFQGNSKRISFEEAEQIRDRAKKEDIADNLFIDFLHNGLKRIADWTLRDATLSRFFVSTGAYKRLATDEWRAQDYPGEGAAADGYLAASAVHNIVSAVACLEGNVPPNDLGYMFDRTSSLVRRDELAVDWLKDAKSVFEKTKLFGENPGALFNAIANRIEANRPTFMRRPVRPDVPTPRMD